jgi:hypothetical protein
MAIAPADGQKFAAAIRAYYDNVENVIMEKIANRIAKDGEEPDSSHWLQKKLSEVQRHKNEINGIIRKLAKEGPKAITDLTMQGYLSGMVSADQDLDKKGADMLEDKISVNVGGLKEPAEVVSSFGRTHVAAIASIVAQNLGGLQGAHMKMLRSAEDAYKNVIMDVAQSGIAGVDTRKQATQRALNKFADKGIGAFTDRTGKEWDIGTYAEMATRTSMAHAHVQGHINRMTQQGHDLVVVSSHPEPSHLCEPHQQQVYSISGNHPRFKPLKWAISRGLFHPNCRHTINAWIEGLSDEPPAVKADPEGYKMREHQRKLERKIKDWKKREVVAITPKDKKFAADKVKYWQSEMRTFIKATGRRRHYTREQINARVVGLPAAPAGSVKDLPASAKVVPFKQITDTAKAKTQESILVKPIINVAPSKMTMDDLEDIQVKSQWHRDVIDLHHELATDMDFTMDQGRKLARDLQREFRDMANKSIPFSQWSKELQDYTKSKASAEQLERIVGKGIDRDTKPVLSPPPKPELVNKGWNGDNTKISRDMWEFNDKPGHRTLVDIATKDGRYNGLHIHPETIDNIYGSRVTMEGLGNTYNPDRSKYDVVVSELRARPPKDGRYVSEIKLDLKDKNGYQIGTIKRTIIKTAKRYLVSNDYFEIHSAHQGGGIAANLYFKQEQLFKSVAKGMPIKIVVHANIDVGGYAWTRYGFDFKDEDEREQFEISLERHLKIQSHKEAKAMGLGGADLDRMTKELIKKKLAKLGYNSVDEIKHSWQFAALDDGEQHPYDGKKVSLGKLLMLGSDWEGSKELNVGSDGEKISNLYYEQKGIK